MCATRSTFRAWIAAVVLSLGLIAPTAAGAVENSMARYWRGDYATAMRLLRPIADEGNADAQLRLGHMYASGQGVPQDDATAVTWFRKATDQGNAAAQTYLGFMYQSGPWWAAGRCGRGELVSKGGRPGLRYSSILTRAHVPKRPRRLAG